MIINCDLGERGAAHPIDDQIIQYVGMINLACGGHAGDIESVKYYLNLAMLHKVMVSAHFSYSDQDNFGRKENNISWDSFLPDLIRQFDVFTSFNQMPLWCKPHGALYHRVHQDEDFASQFLHWLQFKGFQGVVGMPNSIWLQLAQKMSMKIMPEVFAERRYCLKAAKVILSPRSYLWASIHEVDVALNQALQFLSKRPIQIASKYNSAQVEHSVHRILEAQTICVHSDSPIALELVQKISIHHV